MIGHTDLKLTSTVHHGHSVLVDCSLMGRGKAGILSDSRNGLKD